MISHTKYYEQLVREFHDIFEVERFSHPDKAPFDVHRLRARLIDEEHNEYLRSAERTDILDAICDLIYVVAGTAVTYSIEVTPYSSAKCPLIGWFPKPPIGQELRPLLNDLHSMFPCPIKLKESINPVLQRLDDIGELYNFHLFEAFMTVHKNNMNKLWNTVDDTAHYHVKRKGNAWLVKDKGGKIIKPPGHAIVDLKAYV